MTYCEKHEDALVIEKDYLSISFGPLISLSSVLREMPKNTIIGEPMRPEWIRMKNSHIIILHIIFILGMFFSFPSSALCLHTLSSISQKKSHILLTEMLKLSKIGTSTIFICLGAY